MYIVSESIKHHFDQFNLWSTLQLCNLYSAPFHSTKTVLLRIQNDLYLSSRSEVLRYEIQCPLIWNCILVCLKVLCPMPFTLYVLPIGDMLALLYMSTLPSDVRGSPDAINLHSCLSGTTWIGNNRLKLDYGKTKLLLQCSPHMSDTSSK